MQAFSGTITPYPILSATSSSCSAAVAATTSNASVSVASSYHTAEAAGRLRPAAGAAVPAATPGASVPVKPFDRELFRAFISAASRLFCDDEQIVVIDFLAHHEKAFTERELSDRLHWGERRVREACAALERLVLVAKEHMLPGGNAALRKSDNDIGGSFPLQHQQDAAGGGQQAGGVASSAPSYYRISPFCFLVFHYRLQRMEQHVEAQRRNAESRDVFFCPTCRTQYDALEAQLLDVHPLDAHFLCKYCNERLEHEDSKLLLQQATTLQERCEKQLQVLKTLVRRGWNMQIPTFPPFTRAEKNQQKLKSSEEEEKHKKGVLALHGDNLNGHVEETFLPKQSQAGLRAQPSWVTGGPVTDEERAVAAGDTSRGRTPGGGSESKSAVSVYSYRGSGSGWGQGPHLTNKAVTGPRLQMGLSGRMQQPQSTVSSASGSGAGTSTALGGRNQIKFAMKSTGLGAKSASVSGSRLRVGHQHAAAAAASSSPDKTPNKLPASAAATSAPMRSTTDRSNVLSAETGTPSEEGRESGQESVASSSVSLAAQQSPSSKPSSADVPQRRALPTPALQQTPQQQGHQEASVKGDNDYGDIKQVKEGALNLPAVTDSVAATSSLSREDMVAVAANDIDDGGPPLLYVSRLGREMSLEEAADYQQEMTPEEHEKFMELQAMYLDEI